MLNNVILQGRLANDPSIREDNESIWGEYLLAVNRDRKTEGSQSADFVFCVVNGKNANVAAQYLREGMKVLVKGEIQSGTYYDEDGRKVYTVKVKVHKQYFDMSYSE